MKELFKPHRFNTWSRKVLALCNEIIDKYLTQGYKLTLRQLYYQLVTRKALANIKKRKKK